MPQDMDQRTVDNPTRRPRKLKFILALMVILFVIVLFLPTILVNTSLKQRAIDIATGDLNGTVEIEDISVGWFSPIRLHQVALSDDRKSPVLTAEKIETSLSLFALITGNDYGTIKVVRPEIRFVTRRDGSNLEDILAAYVSNGTDTEKSSNSVTLPKLELEIQDGLVLLATDSLEGTHRIEDLNCLVKCSSSEAPIAARIQCLVKSANHTLPGEVAVSILVDKGNSELQVNQLNVEVKSDEFAASVLAPILNRVMGPTNCAGQITCDFQLEADLDALMASTEVRSFHAKNIAVVAPDLIGRDQFSAANLTASGNLNFSPERVAAETFNAESEFARIKVDGEFDFAQLSQLAAGAEIPSSGFQLDGVVDLAQVTTMLPETTHLRQGVQMKSGFLKIHANSRMENGSPRLVINADTANMNAMVNGQLVNWQQPLRLALVAGKKNDLLMVENFQLESDFIHATGSAALDHGELKLTGNLRKVSDQLGQLIDLGGLDLSGDVSGNLAWQTDAEAVSQAALNGGNLPIDLRGKFRIDKPDFQIPGYRRWQEDTMNLALISKLTTSTGGQLAVAGARVDVELSDEKAVAVLKQAIDNVFDANKFQFECQATGSLAKWLAQAKRFSDLPEFFADGKLSSQFIFTVNPKSCRVNQCRFKTTDFVLDGFGMKIREPELSGKLNLKYDFETGLIEFAKSSVKGNGVSANTQQLILNVNEKILLDGVVGFRTSLNHASNWFELSLPRDDVRWDGDATGKMTFSSDSGFFGGNLESGIQDLVVVQLTQATADRSGAQVVSNQRRYEEIWNEPSVRITSKLDLADDFNSLRITNLQLQSKLADISGGGSVSDLANQLVLDWTGQWNLKWNNINQTIKELIGDMVRIEGEGWQPLSIRGPLFALAETSSESFLPASLQASASFNIRDASVMEFQLGSSALDIVVDQSVAQLSSNNKQGMVDQFLQLKPIVDLRTANPSLIVGQGKLLDQWQLTAEDSRTWIKYAAPMIADATSTQGTASIELQGASVPLFDPMQATARGQMEIHELVVGAGPLAQQLIPLIDQVKAIVKPGSSSVQSQNTWLRLNPQTIPVVVQKGRVYHDQFAMHYKELTIRTKGSVGFDQTMSLVAEIPIQEDWISGNQALATLRGKSLQIPIQGTINKPRIDKQAIGRLTQQLIRDTAINAAKDKVGDEVNKLQQKYGNKIQEELGKFQENVNGKIQNQIENKLQDELKNGIKNLFGGNKK